MTDIQLINIDNHIEFEEFLHDLACAKVVVADTETNGLRYYRDSQVISISVFFPEFNRAYNIPYRHGEGVIDVDYNASNEGKEFSEMNWSGKAKDQLFLRHWWAKFKNSHKNITTNGKVENYFGNIPTEWVNEIKALWGGDDVRYVFHNARFDLHMLNAEGFPTPNIVEDTMIALHLVHEDWRGITIDAPYKQKGKWVVDGNGKTMRKKLRGNRQLKFQANYFNLPFATVGEAELIDAKEAMERRLAEFIMNEVTSFYIDPTKALDPYLDGLIYADILKRKKGCLDKWGDKQLERIQNKIKLDSKSNMWMLPSADVATYAMLDTTLTWQLREKLMPIMEKWHNVDLYHNLCDIQLNVSWVMERNGLTLDAEEAMRQIDIYTPRIAEIEDKFNELAKALSDNDMLEVAELNPNSNKQLPPFLQKAVTISFDDLDEFIPSWVSSNVKATLNNVPYEVGAGHLLKANKEALRPFEEHPVVWLLLEYRKLKKTVGTYLSNWLSARDKNNTVRGSLDITGTVAGRMSSYGDMGNIQNIPERNGYTVKKSFIALPKHLLFAIDYGQLEARIASYIAEVLLPAMGAYTTNPVMVGLFESGEDMHAYVRDMVGIRDIMFRGMSDVEIHLAVGEPYENKTPEQQRAYVNNKVCRQIAKTLNFGLLYSGTYRMIQKLLRIGKAEAMELETRWRNLFPAFAQAQNYYHELALTYRLNPAMDLEITGLIEEWRAKNTNDSNSDLHLTNMFLKSMGDRGKGQYGMYVTQPITGRHRKLHMYDTYQSYFDRETNTWKSFNPRDANARKTWNNVVQGLGGWMSVDAMNRYYHDYGYGGMKPYAQIHDALDGQIHENELARIPVLMDYMVDYDVRPNLTVDLEAGYNWQPYTEQNPLGMREVHDVDLWIASKGKEGY